MKDAKNIALSALFASFNLSIVQDLFSGWVLFIFVLELVVWNLLFFVGVLYFLCFVFCSVPNKGR